MPPTMTISSICRRLQLGIGHRLQHRAAALLDQMIDELLELGAAQRHLQVLGPAGVGRDERQVDVRGSPAATDPSWPARPLP